MQQPGTIKDSWNGTSGKTGKKMDKDAKIAELESANKGLIQSIGALVTKHGGHETLTDRQMMLSYDVVTWYDVASLTMHIEAKETENATS